MHAVDWSDTLVEAAGGKPGELTHDLNPSLKASSILVYKITSWLNDWFWSSFGKDLLGDGVSQWAAMVDNLPGPRTELVYNYDSDIAPEEGHAAIRYI